MLGGTTDARLLAARMAVAGVSGVYAYAGRTLVPAAQALPVRVGGFGGSAGLAAFLRQGGFTHVVDATHPFAARMSGNAVEACRMSGVALCALERAAWVAGPGDDWREVADMAGAVVALPEAPARVFLAIGRQHLADFAGRGDLDYLLRLVDPYDGVLPLPRARAVIGRGPFTAEGDLALMRGHGITHVVAKNAGGAGAAGKLVAARILGLPVIMVARPWVPARLVFPDIAGVMGWLGHPADLGV